MTTKGRRTKATWIVVPVVAVGFVLVHTLVLAPALHRRHVNAVIEEYSIGPDFAAAEELIGLVSRQRVPREQGDRIMAVLLTPRVAVRQAYSSDKPVYITTSLACPVTFRRSLRSMSEVCAGSEVFRRWSRLGYNHESSMPEPIEIKRGVTADGSVHDVSDTGVYSVVLRYRYTLLSIDVMAPREELRSATPLYECVIEVPVRIRVVEPDASERVRVVSGAHLDSEIKGAFSTEPSAYGLPGIVSQEPLPENIAFRVAYRNEDGVLTPFDQFSVVGRGGNLRHSTSGKWIRPVPWDRLELPTGRHRGTLVLRTDEELAYQDAAMKTVWGGFIELPVEFEITDAAE